jgi:hypothetical protein
MINEVRRFFILSKGVGIMKGKDFFSRKSKSDFFETPYSMTEQLLENEKFNYNKEFGEPACGKKAIVKILDKYISKLRWADKYYSDIGGATCDFISDWDLKVDYIITNPPFTQFDKFVEKAKQIATEKFAFLGRLEFLTGIGRYYNLLYRQPSYPLTKVYVFVRKANLEYTTEEKEKKYNLIPYRELREDGKYPAGMYHYCWMIFEKNDNMTIDSNFAAGIYPVIKWINNQQYILHKRDK